MEKNDLTSDASNSGVLRGLPVETKELKEFLVMDATLDNQRFSLYFSYSVIDIDQRLVFLEERIWINSEGLILKTARKVSNTISEIVKIIDAVKGSGAYPVGLQIDNLVD